MDIQKFEKTVKPGDGIILYSDHNNTKSRDGRNLIFLGFEACNTCGDPCKGRITLLNKATKMEISGCFRTDTNIRLEMKPKTEHLPEELFEV